MPPLQAHERLLKLQKEQEEPLRPFAIEAQALQLGEHAALQARRVEAGQLELPVEAKERGEQLRIPHPTLSG